MILLLGGTSDSRKIAQLLKEDNEEFLLSTASEYGGLLAKEVADKVQAKIMDEKSLESFCINNKISFIIDATHPFAVNISQNAISVAKKLKIKYLRYERESIAIKNNSLIYSANNTAEAIDIALNKGSNILLTVGSRQLNNFSSLINRKNVFVRILPECSSFEICHKLGVLPNKIIAIQGPFSLDFNKSLLKEKKIDLVISKESGSTGGTDTKIEACLSLNIPLILIKRPKMDYPQIAQSFKEIIDLLWEGKNELSN